MIYWLQQSPLRLELSDYITERVAWLCHGCPDTGARLERSVV